MTEKTQKPRANKSTTQKKSAKPKIVQNEQAQNTVIDELFKDSPETFRQFQDLYQIYQELYYASNDAEHPFPQMLSEEELLRCVELFFTSPKINESLLNLFNLENYTNIHKLRPLLEANIGATFIQFYANLLKKVDDAKTLEDLHKYFKPMGSNKTVTSKNTDNISENATQYANYNPQDIIADLHHWFMYEFDEDSDGITQPLTRIDTNEVKYLQRHKIYMRSITVDDLSKMGDNGIDLSFLGDENTVNLSNYSAILSPNAYNQMKKLITKSMTGAFKQPLFVFEDGTPIEWAGSVARLQAMDLTQFFFVFANIFKGKVFLPLKQRETELRKLLSFTQ